MAACFLQVLKQLPVTSRKLKSIHLVENSATMRALQEDKLRKTSQEDNYEIVWHDAIEEIEHEEDVFTMLVAHEFFDALPVNVIEVSCVRNNEGLYLVGIIENSTRLERSVNCPFK
jgi:SAM-dependent MidA family methyltransferase